MTFFVAALRQTGCTSSKGEPGCGKTTLGLQFLLEGKRNNDVASISRLSEGS